MSDIPMTNEIVDGSPPQMQKPNVRDGHNKRDLEKFGRYVRPVDPVPAALKEPESINVGRMERIACIIGGAGLVAYGIGRRGWPGLAAAGAGVSLAMVGISGHCSVYEALRLNTAPGDSRETNGVHVEQAITIDRSPEELYVFWRDFENQALISDYVISVEPIGETISHWVAKGPAGRRLEWDAEVINDKPNELVAWRTLPGADIEHAGSVRFRPAPGGRGTEVHVTMQYYPPAGNLGAGIAMALRREPSIQAADTLRRLKRLMETGEVVKVDGQSHGKSLQRTAIHPKS